MEAGSASEGINPLEALRGCLCRYLRYVCNENVTVDEREKNRWVKSKIFICLYLTRFFRAGRPAKSLGGRKFTRRFESYSFRSLGYSQVVRHRTLNSACAGSNPATPVRSPNDLALNFVNDEHWASILSARKKGSFYD